MFNKYYQDELSYLRDLGREFAREYPAIAPVLGDAGGDPDVERLLEGVAFLTGRVRQKLDDDVPEVIHAIAGLLFPHLLRPIPAATILELLPLKQAVRDKRTIAAGTEFDSVPIDGTPTRFCSTATCEVMPWTLERVRLESPKGNLTSLVLELVLSPGITLGQLRPSQVRLHLAGDNRNASSLMASILTKTCNVRLQAGDASDPSAEVKLGPAVIRQVGFDDDEAMLPECETVLPGLRLALEYFTCPQKFAFIDIGGLDRIAQRFPEAQSIKVSIDLNESASGLQHLLVDAFRLHCVPVANVFRTTAEPIRIQADRERYTIHPAGLSADRGAVYALGTMTGIEQSTGRRHKVPPFFSYEHARSMPGGQVSYIQHLEPSVLGTGAELSVSLERSTLRGRAPTIDVLSIDLLATNSQLGGQVRAGDIRVATPTSPAFATFRNLTAVTPNVPVLLGRELQWRVIAHASMGLRSLTEANAIRSMLSVYNLIGLVDRQAERANELRIQAIRDIRVRPLEHIHRGSSVRGVGIDIDLDESGFAGEGDLYLYGTILDRLFGSYVPLNSFAVTAVQGVQSHVRYSWPARSGSVALL